MLDHDLAAHARSAATEGPVFHDRGVPDVMGHLTLCGLPVPAHMDRAAREFRYHRQAFIAPVWPEIFAQDAERRQDLDEARRTPDVMAGVYPAYGYDLIELPRATASERVAFVLERLKA